MTHRYLTCFYSIMMAHTDGICYLFMFVNHMVNADLLSFVFPAVVLGYALMENPRPSKSFWKALLLYAELVIFIKFVMRFSVWELIRDDLKNYHDEYKIGVNFSFSISSARFLRNIIIDTLTILSILAH